MPTTAQMNSHGITLSQRREAQTALYLLYVWFYLCEGGAVSKNNRVWASKKSLLHKINEKIDKTDQNQLLQDSVN